MVKTFKNFYIINDTTEPWSQAEMKYLLWRTTSLNMKLSSFQILCLPDTLPPDSVCLLFGEKVIGKYLDGKLKSIRGSVYPYLDGVMIPTYHPRDLATLRRTTENGDFQGSSIWGMDFKKAIKIFEHGYQPLVEDFNIYPTMSEVMSFIDEILAEDLLVAVDLETTGRDSNIDIFMIGLATSEIQALCIPIYRQGGDTYWSNTEYPTILAYINKLFSNARQVYQNALFDVRVLLQRQIKVNLDKVEHDTMLLHHTISPALPHDLGFITSVYGQTPAWKDILKESHYSIKGLSDVDARTYNLRDCCVLHQILPPMIEDAKEMDVYQTYLEEPMSSIPAALEQMSTGIYVDPEAVKVWSKDIKTRLRDSEAELRVMGKLPDSFNLMSQDHLRWFLFQEPLPRFETLPARLAEYKPESKQAVRCQNCNRKAWVSDVLDFLCPKCGSKVGDPQDEYTLKTHRQTGTKAHLALLAEQELLNLEPLYPLKFHSKLTKSQKQATDADARLSLEVSLSKRISEINNMTRPTRAHAEEKKGFQRILEWIREYNRFSKAHKYSSTYTEFPVWPDGCIHPNVLLHGTETGRPASRGPNMLNQPKDEPLMRGCYSVPPGYVIVSFDYSNFEIGCLAYITKDPLFIQDVESGNVHDVNTENIYDLHDHHHPDWKTCRKAAKIFQFATVQYGGSARNTAQKMTLVVPHRPVTETMISDAMNKYFDRYVVFGQWRQEMEQKALDIRLTESAFGRKRKLYGRPDQRVRQGYNFPAQATAAGIMNRVQAMALKARDSVGLNAKLQIQIYDDLRWVCPQDEVTKLIEVVKPIMESSFIISGVPRTFKVDIEIGKTWADLKDYDPEAGVDIS